jgi:ubiquitin carboxyl-terminal hydrolase 7
MKKIQLDNAGTIMVFLKHFDTTRQSLLGIGKIHMPRASKVSDLVPIINERMRWASGTPLKFYEVMNSVFSLTRRTDLTFFSRKSNLA